MVDLSKYKAAPLSLSANYLLIPVTVIPASDEGMREFNEIYAYHRSLEFYNTIVRTKSGGISLDRKLFRPPCWDIRRFKSGVELTSLLDSGMRRFQFRDSLKIAENGVTELMPGGKAIRLFAQKLKQLSGIDLNDYAIPNGLEVRETVPKYLIKVNNKFIKETVCIEDALTYHPVHHIDFHSSFPAGLANTHPEFRPTIEYLYKHRKTHPEYKGCLNSTIGAMWSPTLKEACFAHLSRDAITDNNRRVEALAQNLTESGRFPLLWNVDGIWYLGDEYHGPGEGAELGEWENDHVNCRFRAKTRGAYEYIENSVYTPVIRGVPNDIKKNWSWGDIFSKHETWQYGFDDAKGVYRLETAKI